MLNKTPDTFASLYDPTDQNKFRIVSHVTAQIWGGACR